MVRYLVIYLPVILLSVSQAFAQSYAESAMVFSRTRIGGSARIQGIGGAQIALGGDYSSAYSNPAGLGMYNRSEVAISPGYRTQQMSTTFLGNDQSQTDSRFHVPGFGIVINIPKDNNGSFGGSVAFTMNKTNDFNSTISYGGVNQNSSMIDYFIDDAFGYTTAQFDEGEYQYNRPTGLAYFNYLIGPVSLIDPSDPDGDITYFKDIETVPTQRETITTEGGMYQWNIAYGGNYSDRFFYGVGIGISSIRYESSKFYEESFTDDIFFGFDLAENLSIRGAGINATFGITARPVDMVQIGLSYSTPTLYELTETYDADMNSRWKDFDYYGDGSVVLGDERAYTDIVTSDYNLQTPARLSTGIAIITKMGFISADVEFTNPEKAKYSSNTPSVSYEVENDDIRSLLKSTTNFRVGGEYRYESFRVRAGYGLMGSAYDSSFDIDNKITTISLGLGYRVKGFFVDFAWVQTQSDNLYYPYSFYYYDIPNPEVGINNTFQNYMVTCGITF